VTALDFQAIDRRFAQFLPERESPRNLCPASRRWQRRCTLRQ